MQTGQVLHVLIQRVPEAVQLHGWAWFWGRLKENSIALVGCLATAIAAYANIRSASIAKQTVIAANKEREEARERARPKISIKGSSCNNIQRIEFQDVKTQKQVFDYTIVIANELKSKLSSIHYVLIPFCNGRLYQSDVEELPLYGDDRQEIGLSTHVDKSGITPAKLSIVYCFIRSIDVYGNTRDITKQILHKVHERLLIENRIMWEESQFADSTNPTYKEYNYRGYAAEDIPVQIIRNIINEGRKFPSVVQDFIYSFEDVKKQFSWFKNRKDIGKRESE
jgi:hypothetical protein